MVVSLNEDSKMILSIDAFEVGLGLLSKIAMNFALTV